MKSTGTINKNDKQIVMTETITAEEILVCLNCRLPDCDQDKVSLNNTVFAFDKIHEARRLEIDYYYGGSCAYDPGKGGRKKEEK